MLKSTESLISLKIHGMQKHLKQIKKGNFTLKC